MFVVLLKHDRQQEDLSSIFHYRYFQSINLTTNKLFNTLHQLFILNINFYFPGISSSNKTDIEYTKILYNFIKKSIF